MHPSVPSSPAPARHGRMPGLAAAFALGFAFLSGTATSARADSPAEVTLRDFFDMPFDNPVLVQEFPGQDSVYLVAELGGVLRTLQWREGAWQVATFDSIPVMKHEESGLMGFAFHPAYPENGKYYVFYVIPPDPGIMRVTERVADSTRLQGSGQPERTLLVLPKPYMWHNGGTMAFGTDGYLYTAIGDGGWIGDPQNRAQNPGVLYGKFLRVDVDGPDAFPEDTTRNYAVPPGNPFLHDPAYLPEIWATGLRSPWKWSFHPETGEIWLGDVGQSTREKVTLVPKGANLGWKIWEGTTCFSGPCSWTGITRPVLDLAPALSRSVIGGVFHEGSPASPLHGAYIFGDYITNRMWAMHAPGGALSGYSQIGSITRVTSFNRDRRGQILATTFLPNPGRIFILESPDLEPAVGEPVRPRRAAPPVARAELLKDRKRYAIWTLDGRRIHGTPTGAFLVTDRTMRTPPRIVQPE